MNYIDSIQRKRREYIVSFLFLLPSALLILYMVFYPIFNTLYISFFKWDGISPRKNFIGLENYKYVLNDPKFWRALKNNFIWLFVHIFLTCFYGLILAFFISKIRNGRAVFRTVLFLPNIITAAVAALIWTMIYNTQFGLLISVVRAFGIDTSKFMVLSDPAKAIWYIAIANSWQGYGYYMVLFLAGLQNIDTELYEASEIDGANIIGQFINVTLPGLRNVFTFVLSMAIINGLRGFSMVWIMTEGGPGYSSYLMTVYSYIKAFRELSMGRAMVSALLMGVIILTVTVIFNIVREKLDDQ